MCSKILGYRSRAPAIHGNKPKFSKDIYAMVNSSNSKIIRYASGNTCNLKILEQHVNECQSEFKTDDLLKMSYEDMENVATFLLTLSSRSNQLVAENTGTFVEETTTSLFKPKYADLIFIIKSFGDFTNKIWFFLLLFLGKIFGLLS